MPTAASLAVLDWAIPSLELSKALAGPLHILKQVAASSELTHIIPTQQSDTPGVASNRLPSTAIMPVGPLSAKHLPIDCGTEDNTTLEDLHFGHLASDMEGPHTAEFNSLQCEEPQIPGNGATSAGKSTVELLSKKSLAVEALDLQEERLSDDETVLSGSCKEVQSSIIGSQNLPGEVHQTQARTLL